ncbi:hypothetical protein BROUX41_006432 [Berkeleyomyces rouxiae]|uniref:uncharacterized protein n=1 Tax=Berkeleyomyces rouxiae TaxID=2035830 RepID=UPI003B790DAF
MASTRVLRSAATKLNYETVAPKMDVTQARPAGSGEDSGTSVLGAVPQKTGRSENPAAASDSLPPPPESAGHGSEKPEQGAPLRQGDSVAPETMAAPSMVPMGDVNAFLQILFTQISKQQCRAAEQQCRMAELLCLAIEQQRLAAERREMKLYEMIKAVVKRHEMSLHVKIRKTALVPKEHVNPLQRRMDAVKLLLSLTAKKNEDPLVFLTEYQRRLFLLEARSRPNDKFEAVRIVGCFPDWLQREFMMQSVVEFESVEEVCYTLNRLWLASFRVTEAKNAKPTDKEQQQAEQAKERRKLKKARRKAAKSAVAPQCYGCRKFGHMERSCPFQDVVKKRLSPKGTHTRRS